jgi:adenosylcobinamide-phosphate synthase
MSDTAALAVAGALALDALAGEPPNALHPVAWFGRLVPERDWRRPRLAGLALAVCWPLAAALTVGTVVALAGSFAPALGGLAAALALFVTTSLRRLLTATRRVLDRSEADVAAARTGLRALAGRDASELSAAQVRSAAVESLAENLADGLVAPLAGFTLGVVGATALGAPALALGAALAAWVKAVNTLDSMLGYRDRPAGWASARLDDAVMWVPARASALLLAAVCLSPGAPVRCRRWLGGVPSPNSGWPMGTLAAALDVRLEKPGVYVLNPDGRAPTTPLGERALWRVGAAGVLAYGLAGVVVWS